MDYWLDTVDTDILGPSTVIGWKSTDTVVLGSGSLHSLLGEVSQGYLITNFLYVHPGIELPVVLYD